MLHAFAYNLRHLRALPAIAEQGSMSAAAQAIGLSQPALAQGLAKLEEQFGTPLFVRAPDGMHPTAEGRLIIARVCSALDRLTAAMRSLPRSARRGFERAENLLTATQIRALLSLADGGSFLGAARETGVSQPALHRAVRDLEGLCGVALAARSGQRVALTEAGARLARHFRLAGAELLAAREELGTETGEGRIAVGAMPLCRALLLPQAIARTTRQVPGFRFDVAEGSYAELVEPLRDGRIELMIGALRTPCPPDLRQQPLFVDRLIVAARAGHPLTQENAVQRDALRAYPWIIGRSGSPLRLHWEKLFEEAPPPAPIECGSVMAIRGVLLETDFLTLLSPDQIALELRTGLLARIPVELDRAERTIGVIARSDWRPTPLQSRFLDNLAAVASEERVQENE
jgi:LysR family transcriptional regulator, regulator for genes of the gallate degradation pathway